MDLSNTKVLQNVEDDMMHHGTCHLMAEIQTSELKLEGTAHGHLERFGQRDLDAVINHIRRPTGKYAFVRCIDNRPIPISVGILLDPDCKRRPKTTDRGSVTEKFVKISFLFLIRQWAETRLLNGHCPKLKSAESINQTRKAKFDGPELGGTTADFAKIEPAVGTKASAQVQYAREDGDNWVDSILDPMLPIMAARSDVVALTASALGFQTRLLLAS
ncbi:hypothetical protein NOF04DRAFT_1268814 [Fusarium oxysporum II5]|nr:hypothetical protein NOF04DRAFT_1268814 [Fusarium oxysporum II5]